jgi:Skp family chaperone for outer membrane proteins
LSQDDSPVQPNQLTHQFFQRSFPIIQLNHFYSGQSVGEVGAARFHALEDQFERETKMRSQNASKTQRFWFRLTSAFALVLLTGAHGAFAQTNTFPTTGNAGVGTTTPESILTVQSTGSDAGATKYLRIKNTSSYTGLLLDPGQAGDAGWLLMGGFPGAGDFTIRELNVANYFTIKKTSGNIGIGTTKPAFKLDVQGSNGTGLINAASGLCIAGICKTDWSQVGGGGGGGGAASAFKFAVIDTEKILLSSATGKTALASLKQLQEQLETEARKRAQEIKDLQMKIADGKQSLPESQLAQLKKELEEKDLALRRFQDDITRDLTKKRDAILAEIDTKVMPVITQIGKERGYAMIFRKFESGLIYANDALDITALVIQRLDAGR